MRSAIGIAALLAFAAAGCGGSVDKAGGRVSKPLVLTLAAHDDDEAYGTFAAAVKRLSGGSMRIRIAGNWRVTGDRRELDYERGIVDDVRRGKVAIRLGIVAEETFRALGARPAPEVPVDFTGFDGAEVDPLTITENGWDQGVRGLTANVAFWPKAQTVVMNRKAYAALTPEQRRILAEAGREAVAPELAQIAREQRLGISILCGDHGFRFVNATPAEAVALRKAVQPVYARIERDPLTRRWIAQIARERTAPDVVTCGAR